MSFTSDSTKDHSLWHEYFVKEKELKEKQGLTDPFLNDDNCFERLKKEYLKHKKLIVAVDFDSTISPWPLETQSTHNLVIDLVRKCSNLGFYIVIFTASAPERYGAIKNYCREIGLRIDSLNENPISLPYGNHKKIYYNILLDDRAGLPSAYRILNKLVMEIE